MKISVIIPVYGVEEYLNRCVESVVNQTYSNLEIILVDDGSPNNCPQICDDWAMKDKRIKTVHRKNGGQSCARNTGLALATGDYVAFIDSDDWLELDAYEYCYKYLSKDVNIDVIQFDSVLSFPRGSKSINRKEIVKIFKGKDILQECLKTGIYGVCRCLFKRSILKNIYFREGKIYEDIDFKYKVLMNAKCMLISNQIKHHYWQVGNSTSSGKFSMRDLQLYDAAEELYKLTKDDTYENIAFLGKAKLAKTPFSLLSRIAMWGTSDTVLNEKEIINKLISEHRKSLPILLKSSMPFTRKVLAVLFYIDYNLAKSAIYILKNFIH